MTSLMVEMIDTESTARAARALQHARERSLDDLGGRTVWCAAALPRGRERARSLREALARSSEACVRTEALAVAAHEPLRELAERLAAVLASSSCAPAALGRDERELYDEAVEASESWLDPRVRGDDVVVLHDPLAAVLASAARGRRVVPPLAPVLRAGPGTRSAGTGRLVRRSQASSLET